MDWTGGLETREPGIIFFCMYSPRSPAHLYDLSSWVKTYRLGGLRAVLVLTCLGTLGSPKRMYAILEQ